MVCKQNLDISLGILSLPTFNIIATGILNELGTASVVVTNERSHQHDQTTGIHHRQKYGRAIKGLKT